MSNPEGSKPEVSNLYTVLSDRFMQAPEKVALQTPEGSYTYAQVHHRVGQMANWLKSLDLPAGSRVAAQVEKSPEALFLYLAAVRAGYTYLPLNTAYRQGEIEYFLGNAEPAVVVCDPANLSWVQGLANQTGCSHVVTLDALGQGGLTQVAQGFSGQCHDAATAADDLAAILYTSGTTGRSKGAMLTHRNLISNAQTLHHYWGWSSNDVLLHMLPIFHIHGLFVACHGALHAGATMIWLPKLDVDAALHYLPDSTIMMGVPTYYVRLLSDPRFDRHVTRNMRLFVSGSAPLLLETFESFEKQIGQPILERYGMSETGMLTSNPYNAQEGARIGSTVGKPLPGVEVRVVDDAGKTCPVNEIGHVQVRGPNVFVGYWQMPEKTREEFTADGWFKTGDMGRWGGQTPQGQDIPADYLSIVGRSKDLIISGGYNVYPKEIESVIDDMPGVLESAVIGVPHPDFGEAVVAVVVPAKGVVLDVTAMIADLKVKLANYKVPKHVYSVDELPRNTMGKVQKNVLRQQYGKDA
ncbi:malonate--CoA ligase [Orrella daihaiensis]|uniref:malonate--CoA ligase n=1 Tax=Orrella daihaiensis TaxID=2782176 RepID=UPI00350EB025